MEEAPVYWTVRLDALTARMSIVPTSDEQPPIFATPDSLSAITEGFASSPKVPAEIADLLCVARKLLVASSIHYGFAALSMEKSLQALELAVRMHFCAGTGPSFRSLIERFKDDPAMSGFDVQRLHDMRRFRNMFAHPQGPIVFPLVTAVGWVRLCSEVVVGIFD